MIKPADPVVLLPEGARVRWLASFPKSGNTWVRAFLANLLAPQEGRALTLGEISAMPFYTDQSAVEAPPHREFFGKAHYMYTPEIHGDLPAVYIMRDPLDIVPSAADFFGVSHARMATEVARDWPKHVNSWLAHCKIILRYENMPDNFHALAQEMNVPDGYEEVVTAISRVDFKLLRKDERRNGFSEASQKSQGDFFRRGTPGAGREVLSRFDINKLTTGLCGDVRELFRYEN